jgi:adenosylhomocysteine nucleosidase
MSNILLISATRLEHHDEELSGIPIHIVGVGKVNAALNTYKLIQEYKPDHVINFGSCGSLGDHRVGDILPIGTVYDDFYGCVIPEHKPLSISESPYTLFTTDTFYDSTAVYSNSYMENIRKCDVVDMEGYSIVKVCKELNVKVSIYKWVSDDGNKLYWKQNAASGYEQFKKMMNDKIF